MTIERAKQYIASALLKCNDVPAFVSEAYYIIEKALDKATQKKPTLKLHTNRVPGEQEEYYCPCCGEWLAWKTMHFKHCPECGQAIDWSEVE